VVAGSLAASATSAAARDYNDPYAGGAGHGQNCQPIYNKVSWYDRWGYLHFTNQYVGQRCWPAATQAPGDGRDWNWQDGRADGRWWDRGDDHRRGGDGWLREDRGYRGDQNGWTFGFGFGG
jgi:hypothetical protein